MTRYRSTPPRPARTVGFTLEIAGGRKPRGARTIDLLIASIAVAENLPLFTRNPGDFANLASILDVVAV